METTQLLFSCIRSVLTNTPLKPEVQNALSAQTLSAVYRLSEQHDMSHMMGAALSRADIPKGEETAKFEKKLWLALSRYERIRHEQDRICETLEQAEIPFIPLKGAVIRRYYPEPWLRTSCDIDVLVQEHDVDRAITALKETLQYTVSERRSYHDVSLYSPGKVHLELHFNIKEGKPRFDKVLINAWNYALPVAGKTYHHEFTLPFLKFHLLAHAAYHFLSGGCGFKPLIDLWLLDKEIPDDTEFCELLEQSGLTVFTEKIRKLYKVWFENEKTDTTCEAMQAYILSGGVYGTTKNKVAVRQQLDGGKWGYVHSRLFISYEFLQYQYPIIKKHRWLSPVMQVCRWFRLLFCGGIEHSKRQVNLNFQVDKDKADSLKQLLHDVGL